MGQILIGGRGLSLISFTDVEGLLCMGVWNRESTVYMFAEGCNTLNWHFSYTLWIHFNTTFNCCGRCVDNCPNTAIASYL